MGQIHALPHSPVTVHRIHRSVRSVIPSFPSIRTLPSSLLPASLHASTHTSKHLVRLAATVLDAGGTELNHSPSAPGECTASGGNRSACNCHQVAKRQRWYMGGASPLLGQLLSPAGEGPGSVDGTPPQCYQHPATVGSRRRGPGLGHTPARDKSRWCWQRVG